MSTEFKFNELLPKTFYYDFVASRQKWMVISSITVTLCVLMFVIVGPSWGIDFTGGTEVQFRFLEPTTRTEVVNALEKVEIEEGAIQQLGPEFDNRYSVRMKGESGANEATVAEVKAALSTTFGADWIEEWRPDSEVGSRVSVLYRGEPQSLDKVQAALSQVEGLTVQGSPEDNTVYVRLPGTAEEIASALKEHVGRPVEIEASSSIGPKVGASLKTAGLLSVAVTMLLLLVIVGLRFDFTFAAGAIICLFHDAALVCGLWVLARNWLEFDLNTLSAILTLVGYSLNDTIVIFDRIRENMERYRRKDIAQLVNDSVNQTLSRSIITNGATGLAMIPFLFLGGPVLRNFAIAMLFGIIVGSYSTIYVASPIMLLLKEHQDTILDKLGLSSKKPSPKT